MTNSGVPSFTFSQFVLPVSSNDQDASGGDGGNGGAAQSNPFAAALGDGGAGGNAAASASGTAERDWARGRLPVAWRPRAPAVSDRRTP